MLLCIVSPDTENLERKIKYKQQRRPSYNPKKAPTSFLLEKPQIQITKTLSYYSIKEFHEKKKFLIYKIIKNRKRFIIKIQSYFRTYLFNKKFKKIFLLKKILNQHLLNIIKIQAVFKSYLCRKSINNILKNNDHIFLYEFQKNLLNEIMFFSKNNDCKNTLINLDPKDLNIQMVLKEKKRDELLFNFIYNKYLKCHYTSINKIKILKKRILVNFIINNEKILDPRFEITNDKNNNNFYNVIYSKHIYKKYKDKKIVTTIKKNKYWEELFILKTRKISVDNSSISSKTDISSISRELNKNFYINNNNNSNMACDNIENKNKKNPPKGILKGIKKGNNNNKNKILKKVSFKENIEICI